MGAAFRFEIGVFEGSFVPTAGNVAEWASSWRPAARVPYDLASQRYSGQFVASSNPPPFAAGKPAYVWGFHGTPAAGEWVLFRADDWNWPSASGFMFHEWFAKDATAIVGEIHSSGSPFLMRSAAVTQAAPPATSWAQWRADHLTGEPLSAPVDDPDKDGSPNLIEFVFGTPPRAVNAPVSTPVSLVAGHLQITIPRRIDHPVNLVVEVSNNLQTWNSGPAHTETVSDTLSALVVRDLTPFGGANPKRFIRLRAVLP
jgi:hypothetical protein